MSGPKIAIVGPSIGVIRRGFERFFSDTFEMLKDDFDLTLFKGGGPVGANERVPPYISRSGRLVSLLPVHKALGRTAMHTEMMSYAMAVLPALARGKFDIVHTIDPPLARLLFELRNAFSLKFRMLYTEGCAMPATDYPPADHMLHTTKITLDEAIAFGRPAEAMTLLPCGFKEGEFKASADRASLRRAYGIDQDTFVILSVAAFNRSHKRIDHLIEEVAAVEGNVLLWLDGSREHPDNAGLVAQARSRLGERCRVTHFPSRKLGDLFGMADLLVHTALFEAFGLAPVEAAASGLPILIHNAAHFQWLLPNPNCWVDMAPRGVLTERLRQIVGDPSQLNAMRCTDITRKRFSWRELKPQYADMYRQMAHVPISKVPANAPVANPATS